jgi:hypothetical protein
VGFGSHAKHHANVGVLATVVEQAIREGVAVCTDILQYISTYHIMQYISTYHIPSWGCDACMKLGDVW